MNKNLDTNSQIGTQTHVKPTSFGIFNKIYCSSLPQLLKHHFACRELCLRYKAMGASILLYNGKKDKLISKAIYLNRGAIKSTSASHKEDKQIAFEKLHFLRFIGFYHHIFFWFISTGIPKKISNKECLKIYKTFINKTHLRYGFPSILEVPKKNKPIAEFLNQDNNRHIIRFVQYCVSNSRKHASNLSGVLDNKKFYYNLNKLLVEEDEHEIRHDANSFSGKVFYDYSDKNSYKNHDHLLFKTQNDYPNSGFENQCYEDFQIRLRQLGFEFKVKPFLVGIPLLSNGRCIGIIRLFYHIDKENRRRDRTLSRIEATKKLTPPASNNYRIIQPVEKMLYASTPGDIIASLTEKNQNRSLLYSIQMLGYFIEQTFPEEYMEKTPRQFELSSNLSILEDKEIYNRWCTDMRNALNCHSCTLLGRQNESQITGEWGHSSNQNEFENLTIANSYKYLLRNDKFHLELENIFPQVNNQIFIEKHKQNSNPINVVAATIDFNSSFHRAAVSSYYYTEQNEEVRPTRDIQILSNNRFKNLSVINLNNNTDGIITPEFYKLFTGYAIRERNSFRGQYILLLEIPSPDVCGLVVFTNSKNRKFTLSDVRFAYGQIKRLGLEISVLNRAYTALAIKNSLHHMNHLLDDVNSGLISVKDKPKFERLKKRQAKRMEALRFWMGNSQSYIRDQTTQEKKPYNLLEFISGKVLDEYLEDAKVKGIYIDIRSDSSSKKKLTVLNKKCVWNCLDGIIDNAIERSSSLDELIRKKIRKTREIGPNERGNVTIEFKYENNYIKISVHNYGEKINPLYANSIASLVSPDDITGKRGHGLFLVKQHLRFIDSEWLPPTATQHGSLFSVKIKT